MSTTMTTVVKRLTVVGGLRQVNDDSPLETSVRSKLRRRTDKGELYVLVEIKELRSPAVQLSLREIVSQTFYRDSAAVPASLLRAVRRAWDQAIDLCPDEIDPDDVGIGCLAIKDQDTYLAQVGPLISFLVHDDEVLLAGGAELLSEESPGSPSEDVDVRLFHNLVEPGDIIVLASPSLHRVLDWDRLGSALRGRTAAEVRDDLYNMWKDSGETANVSALIVQIGAPIQSTTGSRLMESDSDSDRRRLPYSDRETPRHHRSARRAVATGPVRRREYQDTENGDRVERRDNHLISRLRGLGDLAFDLVHRWLPTVDHPHRVLVTLTLVLLALSCLIGGVRLWQGHEMASNTMTLLETATDKEQEAMTKQDADLQRRLLLEAQALVLQAESLAKDDPNVRIVRDRIQRQLDGLTDVARIDSSEAIIDLSTAGGSGKASKLILADDRLYILDTTASALFRFKLKEGGKAVETSDNPLILRRDYKLGETSVGSLVALALIPTGGLRDTAMVVCLDGKGSLYQLAPDQNPSPLSMLSAGLTSETLFLDGYAGNLYLLDTQGNQLLWYPPNSTGYDQEVYNYLGPGNSADFTTVTDMCVNSNLYLLHQTGAIDRFFGGKQETFDTNTPDVPLKQPVALAIGPTSQSVYVLDAGNRRVVEFGPEGQYRRQIRVKDATDPFAEAQDLVVDEQHGKLYLLTGQKVYVVDLN